MSKQDYYSVLGISRSANSQEIKKAYLKLAKQYHPDKNKDDPSAEQKFKNLSQAYDTLKDEQKRATYDRLGHSAFENGSGGGSNGGFSSHRGFSGSDVNDIFGDFFSDFMGGNRRTGTKTPQQLKGSDLKYNLEIRLEDAFKGVDKSISFTATITCTTCDGYGTKDTVKSNTCPKCSGSGSIRIQQGFFVVEQTCSRCNGSGNVIKNPCVTCHGEGRASKQRHLIVNIPAGIEHNTRIRMAGEGEAGVRKGPSGDLYVFIAIKPHDIYQVEGADLHFKLPISFTKAALGGEVCIPLIDGSKVKLTIPAGTETGDRLRLKDKGMSKVRSLSRGCLYAHAYVHIPKKLTSKQKALLEELNQELGETDKNYKDEGFFSRMKKNIWS